jgi:hypothetical protein
MMVHKKIIKRLDKKLDKLKKTDPKRYEKSEVYLKKAYRIAYPKRRRK